MSLNRFNKIFGIGLFLVLMRGPIAAQVTLPSPGDSVLIIYTNDAACDGDAGYDVTEATNLENSLLALPAANRPTVTMLAIPCATTTDTSFYSYLTALPAGQNALSDYCVVFDARFLSGNPNETCPGAESDVITNTGANNDTQLYLSFLGQGGHLILIGDNAGFCIRDESMLNFISAAIGCGLGLPNTGPQGPFYWTTFNGPLANAYNNLNSLDPTGYGSDVTGYILSSQICGATALTTNGGNEVLDMLWSAAQLTGAGGSGQLEANFDTNGLQEAMNGYQQYWQNVYAINSNCFQYNVTKTVSPATVCLNQAATFTVCLQNTGSVAIPNPQISDVLPACVTYGSSTPSGTISGTTFIYNDPSPLAAGASICVDIAVTAISTNCP